MQLNTLDDRLAFLKLTILDNKYIPHQPSNKQVEFLIRIQKELFFGGAAGGGKAAHLDELIPTISNNTGFTNFRDVKIGDELFTELGKITKVTHVFDIIEKPECYRLWFDDEVYIDTCADHKWWTFTASELAQLTRLDPEWRAKRQAKRKSRSNSTQSKSKSEAISKANSEREHKYRKIPEGMLSTTKDIYETLRTESGRTNHAIPVAECLDLPEIELPIDPYTLGVWLGDGTSHDGSLAGADEEIMNYVREAGFDVYPSKQKYKWATVGLYRHLRLNGLLDNKHIPRIYFRSSKEQRLALLQGLMDTDGTCNKAGSVEFDNTNLDLAQGVYELASSLGHKVFPPKEENSFFEGVQYKNHFHVKWTPSEYVFKLSRKRERQVLATRRVTKFRYITNCTRIESKPMRCIAVDNPTGLFLVGVGMIPTHNSDALLMAGLQFVNYPDYHALILRRSFSSLVKPDALIARSREWLTVTDAKWNDRTNTWLFPSGSTLSFGYLESEADLYQYQSAAYQFIGLDELTQFREHQYLYMFSRLRQLLTSDIPLRVRGASNPGNEGHAWVRDRFVRVPGMYIPSLLSDNPYLNQEEYRANLNLLDVVTRKRLRDGDWNILAAGNKFNRNWFHIEKTCPSPKDSIIKKAGRYWDQAASKVTKSNPDPDWTVGTLGLMDKDNEFWIPDVTRYRESPLKSEKIMIRTANGDSKKVRIYYEQEPGSSGIIAADHLQRDVFKGFSFKMIKSTGDKEFRADPFSSYAESGHVHILEAPWNEEWLSELELFPTSGVHDDQVDSASGVFSELAGKGRLTQRIVEKQLVLNKLYMNAG